MIPLNFEPVIHVFDELDSTNSKLKDLAKTGVPEGTLVVAKKQTKGRGRLGRSWHSPVGGLYISVLLYPLVPKRITDLPFLVGIAVTQTLQQALPKYLEVSLKWPNDVLVNQKKIAGILSEAFDHNEFYGAVVGVGINVNLEPAELAPFEKNLFSATSVQAITGETGTSLEDILTIFKVKLFNLYRVYQEKGFAPIQALWERNCKMIGKKIEIRNVEPKGETVVGNFWGLSERGGIVLEIPGKDKMEILSGELACCWF